MGVAPGRGHPGPDTYSQIKQGIPVATGDVEPGDLHLDDPATVVISELFIQAWGRKPNAHNAGRRQPVAVPI
jgi:hypothetical protein